MTIVHVAQSWPRHHDDPHGAFLARYVNALNTMGLTTRVLAPSMPGAVTQTGVTRVRYAPRRAEVLAGTGAMHRAARGPAGALLPAYIAAHALAIRRAHGELVHAHWWAPGGVSAVVAHPPCPVVIHLHGTDAAIAPVGSQRARLARLVLRRADVVLAVSKDLVRWAYDVSGVTAAVISMPLHPGLVVTDVPVDGPLLAVGRLVREKGFDVLIRAASAIGVGVHIVGDGPERAALEQLAHQLHADITFVGSIAPRELPLHYQTARAVVVPSRREGLGLVAAEAAACGRTVVASRVGGLPEVVSERNGYLVPADDPDALAEVLENLDVTRGRHGPAQVSWLRSDAIAEQTLAVYERLGVGVDQAPSPPLK
jgi:glycosyltransferase involved in cell wall biosynthesis